MLTKEIASVIMYHIAEKMLIKIERRILGAEPVVGFPLVLSSGFLLMSVVTDFRDEGYAILRTEDITDAYSNKSDEFYEKICILEGLRDISQPNILKSLSSYKQIFECLREYNGFITVQCEGQVEKCAFFLGKIKSVSEEMLELFDIGTDGEWCAEASIIHYDEITQISFGDNYSKMFYTYALPCPSNTDK